MKITKQQVTDLYNGLQAVSDLSGAKWAYAVAKNISILTPEFNALAKAYNAKENYIAYEQERVALARANAELENGKPKIVTVEGKELYQLKDEAKFEKEMTALQKKHKQALDERERQVEQFNEMLKEEVNMDLVIIDQGNIPDSITPAQLSGIMLIIGSGK